MKLKPYRTGGALDVEHPLLLLAHALTCHHKNDRHFFEKLPGSCENFLPRD